MHPWTKMFAVAAAVLVAGECSFAAISVPIANPGFEIVQTSSSDATPVVLGDGDYTNGFGSSSLQHYAGAIYGSAYVPGWVGTGPSGNMGVFNPGTKAGLTGQTGLYTAYINGESGQPNTFSQQLSTTYQPGTYTLSVAVGDRTNLNTVGTPTLQLNDSIPGDLTSSVSPAQVSGGFVAFSRTYTLSASDANLGLPITILLGNATVSTSSQVNLDSVSLQFTPAAVAVPLPSAAWSGLAMLGVLFAATSLRRLTPRVARPFP